MRAHMPNRGSSDGEKCSTLRRSPGMKSLNSWRSCGCPNCLQVEWEWDVDVKDTARSCARDRQARTRARRTGGERRRNPARPTATRETGPKGEARTADRAADHPHVADPPRTPTPRAPPPAPPLPSPPPELLRPPRPGLARRGRARSAPSLSRRPNRATQRARFPLPHLGSPTSGGAEDAARRCSGEERQGHVPSPPPVEAPAIPHPAPPPRRPERRDGPRGRRKNETYALFRVQTFRTSPWRIGSAPCALYRAEAGPKPLSVLAGAPMAPRAARTLSVPSRMPRPEVASAHKSKRETHRKRAEVAAPSLPPRPRPRARAAYAESRVPRPKGLGTRLGAPPLLREKGRQRRVGPEDGAEGDAGRGQGRWDGVAGGTRAGTLWAL